VFGIRDEALSFKMVDGLVADTKLYGWQTEFSVCRNLVRALQFQTWRFDHAIMEAELAMVQCRICGGRLHFLFDVVVVFPGDAMEAELAICVT